LALYYSSHSNASTSKVYHHREDLYESRMNHILLRVQPFKAAMKSAYLAQPQLNENQSTVTKGKVSKRSLV